MMENTLDGNAAAGILQEIFPFEMTLAEVTCTGCGTTNVIGATAAYMHGMGTIVRCPRCNDVLIRIVHARGRYLLDMRGVRVMQMKEGSA
jgi:ribosomal protein S27E